MTQTKMPEPAAEVCSGYTLHWAGSGPIAPLCERTGAKVGSLLITTTQAEAYADARVRQALEAAIAICDAAYEQGKSEYRTSCNPYFEGGCDAAESIESKIRALIPPLPGPATEPKDKS